MKKFLFPKITAMLCVIMLLFSINLSASSETQNVKVQIAPFSTEIQYLTVDNRAVEFPLITYKGITYFPMTYYLCERLGLEATYDSGSGLYITCGNASSSNDTDPFFGGNTANSTDIFYDAYIANYPVYLNGISIDNAKEEYPLLNFRNITYFPMTWHFAYEELNFNIEWSDEDYSFKLYSNSTQNIPYAYSDDGQTILFQSKISVYDKQDDTYSLSHSYWDQYSFNLNSQQMVRLESTPEARSIDTPQKADVLKEIEIDSSVKSDGIYVEDTLALSVDTTEFTGVHATKYELDGSSLIKLYVKIGNAPAPYTQHVEYLLSEDNNGIKVLDWDVKNNFSAIYPDQDGGYYIASSGYSPAQMSRWSNSFCDVYHYTPGSHNLISLADKYSETLNSIQAIGSANGQLYVKAMWYNADKQKSTDYSSHFSAANSGYYKIDLSTGNMEKIYPYISGEAFVASDGNLYCVASYARTPRLVNLCTKQIIDF